MAVREVLQHVRIELLVVDVNLLGISGLERLTLLRRDQSCDKPPVILPSAVPDQPEIGEEIRGTVPVLQCPGPHSPNRRVGVVLSDKADSRLTAQPSMMPNSCRTCSRPSKSPRSMAASIRSARSITAVR